MGFVADLRRRSQSSGSLICVGLDPDPDRFPESFNRSAAGALAFCTAIVDAVAETVCAFKPQIAHFAAMRAESELEALIGHIHTRYPGIPVILDAKRGDIGSTAKRYAVEAFERYRADAVTVNPWLGGDSIEPFFDYPERGVIVLARTSNPGAADFQDLLVEGVPLYLQVARRVARDWNGAGNCALVVGATAPSQLAAVRAEVGDMPILVPGIGAQGGDLEVTLAAGLTADGQGLVINLSRSVLYASAGADFAAAARAEVARIAAAVDSHRAGH